MTLPTLRLFGGPASYEVYTSTGARFATITWNAGALTASLVGVAESNERFTLAYDHGDAAYRGTDVTGTLVGVLRPRREQFANLSGWRLEMPGQGIAAESKDDRSWLGNQILKSTLAVGFLTSDDRPVLRITAHPEIADQYELVSPPTAHGILDWRMAATAGVAIVDVSRALR